MSALTEALWLRALRVADARGLLPGNRSRLTPGELAAEVSRRGESRLARLVDDWYYPASYGRVRGALSDEEAGRIVAVLEAGLSRGEAVPGEIASPALETPPAPPRKTDCELCGFPLASGRRERDA
ncbi:MAG TPA: hypothetical protein VIJ64_05420 [Candidatus Lustribacter sp.]